MYIHDYSYAVSAVNPVDAALLDVSVGGDVSVVRPVSAAAGDCAVFHVSATDAIGMIVDVGAIVVVSLVLAVSVIVAVSVAANVSLVADANKLMLSPMFCFSLFFAVFSIFSSPPFFISFILLRLTHGNELSG